MSGNLRGWYAMVFLRAYCALLNMIVTISVTAQPSNDNLPQPKTRKVWNRWMIVSHPCCKDR